MKRALAVAMLSLCLGAPALAGWKGPTTYRGPSDLALTSALVAAGGGAHYFNAKTLVSVMAGSSTPAALAYLTKKYGAADVAKFFATFTYVVDDSLHYANTQHIALPKPRVPPGSVLTRQLFAAGTMPNGQYDVGYMLEHLVSHPIHMWVMWDINRDPNLGKGTDETFHIILTDAMHTLAHR